MLSRVATARRRARPRPNRKQRTGRLSPVGAFGTARGGTGGLPSPPSFNPPRLGAPAPTRFPGVTPANVRPGAPGAPITQQPAAPAAPPAPPAPPRPVDPFSAQAGDSATTLGGLGTVRAGYQSQLAQLATQEGGLMRSYGVVQDQAGSIVDPATGRRFRVDLEGNPYSLAARVKQQWDRQRTGDTQFAAQSGTLYDGSYGRAVQRTNFDEGQANADLWQGFADAMTSLGGQRVDAFADAMDAILGLRSADADREAMRIDPVPAPAPRKKPSKPANAARARAADSKQRARAASNAAEAEAKARKRRRAKKRRGH